MDLDLRQLIEFATLLGGVIVSVYGGIQQIRARRRDDAELAASAGTNAVNKARIAEDIIALSPTFLAQVQANQEMLAQRAEQAEALLRQYGIVKAPTSPTSPASQLPPDEPPQPFHRQ